MSNETAEHPTFNDLLRNMRIAILSCLAALTGCASTAEQPASDNAKTIVFVHGAWGGAWDYRNLEEMLEAHGHRVQRLTLTGLGERSHLMSADINLDTHIMDVINVLQTDDLENVILVGHSYGGMVITGVADRIPERIRHLVYIDAIVPLDGESMFSVRFKDEEARFMQMVETEGEGIYLPPFWDDWEDSKDLPQPIGTFTQPISLANPIGNGLPATYVLTVDEGADTDDFSPFAERANGFGWDYHEWITGHVPQRTMPETYAQLLLDIE